MPDVPDAQPAIPGSDDRRPWTPAPAPAASQVCGPDWRGTAVEAVQEVTRRYEGTSTAFVSVDASGARSARAVPAEDLVATLQSVTARYGDAGPVYSVLEDGSIHNTVTHRTEYVPVCLAQPGAATPAPTTPTAAPDPAAARELRTRANPTVADLGTLFTHTELGGNANLTYRFSYAGTGNSAYSFGVNQFDVGANPAARDFLAGIGFSGQEIQQLSQHGGLPPATLAPLQAKLQAHTQDVDHFTAPYLANYVTRVNAVVTDLETTNPTAAAAIAGDRTLQLAIIDFDNQYTIGGVGGGPVAANGMLSYLRGNQVTLPGGTRKLEGAPTLADVQGFMRATKYAVEHPTSVENRIQQFNAAVVAIDAAHAAP